MTSLDDVLEALDNAVIVWPFDKAPAYLQALSTHGGDEDWIALMPEGMERSLPLWLGALLMSSDDLEEIEYDGRLGWIGAHA